jgi:hypothetical protein
LKTASGDGQQLSEEWLLKEQQVQAVVRGDTHDAAGASAIRDLEIWVGKLFLPNSAFLVTHKTVPEAPLPNGKEA